MTTPTDTSNPPPGRDATADELEADIESTRDDLGETVDALSRKFDVKGRARHKVQDTRQRVADQVAGTRARGQQLLARAKDSANDQDGRVTAKAYVPAGATVALLVAVGIMVRRRRR
ncbi:MAG: DUF3618 domain-containing protein [Marmoricola sp.]